MNRRQEHRRPERRGGLTLLELILALALTVVLLGLIGMAIDVNLRMLDSRQAEVERAQLARAVLTRIARDLRSAIQPSSSASDMASADGLVDDASAALGDSGADLEDLAGAASDLGLDDSGLSSEAGVIADSTTLPATPGLYGNQYELQFDISRLPRVDEFRQLLSTGAANTVRDIPSDVKTVAYYVRPPGTASISGTKVSGMELDQGGLVRRVLDRQVTLYASETGSVTSLNEYGDVIAPEINAIEFAYFDGSEWATEWDSEAMGGLPLAVRITVSIASPTATDAFGGQASLAGGNPADTSDQTEKIASLVVRIPVAKPNECDTTGTVSAEGLDAVGL